MSNAPPFQFPAVAEAVVDGIRWDGSGVGRDAITGEVVAGHSFDDSYRDAVLIPGSHATADGPIEVGNHEFADDVVRRFPIGVLYRRGVVGELVGEPGLRRFQQSTNDDIRLHTDRNMRLAKWVVRKKPDGEGGSESSTQCVEQFVPCTRDHGGIILANAASVPTLQEIRSLTSYPVYRAGFELCSPGYANGIYFDCPPELDGLRVETDLAVIRTVLADLVIDFPFKADADRQNFFGLLLTPILAPAISGNRPMHLIHSPMERTGKTKLADECLGGIIIGRRTPAQQMVDSVDETDKRTLAMLMRGETLLHLDNLRDFLDSPVIASLLTAAVYQGRILGATRIIDVANSLSIVATGNNVRCSGEIAKRTVPIRLQPSNDRPEERTDFQHPHFFEFVLANRCRVLGCLLGAIELWKAAGKPRGTIPLGGFDEWASTIGGIMSVLGFDQWLTNAREWRASSDTRRSDLEALVNEWHTTYGSGMAKAGELLDIAIEKELFGEVLAGKEGRAAITAFGMRVLSKNSDMPVGRFIIRRSDLSRPAVYFLEGAE
jgi:hypothetical protein